jgi:hypothetical protein
MIYQSLAKVFLICSGGTAKLVLSGIVRVIFRDESARTQVMDGKQATQIRSLLLEAADAIDRANAIVSTLNSDDRTMLATALDETSSALHFELLQKLYLRYPGLPGKAQAGTAPRHDRKEQAPHIADSNLSPQVLA